MVKAIDFVVRDSAGAVVRGSVSGQQGGNFIQMGTGEDISLNLSRSSVASYVRQGDDLVVTLIDGRQVVLDGYFNTVGEANQLYLSQNGEVVAVELSGGNGTLQVAYGGVDGWDKFSALDDLRFAAGDDLALAGGAVVDEQAGMAAFVPGLLGLGGAGAGLIGAAVIGAGVIGGGGGKDGGTPAGPAQPTVDPQNAAPITTKSTDKTITVTGTGEPGDKVTVTIGGKTETGTIGTDGKWTVTFPTTNLPADGSHTTTAVFEHKGGTTTTLPGPSFIIDLTPPDVEITEGAKSTNDVENAAEYKDGVSIKGEGEVGAKVVVEVTVNGTVHTQTTTVGTDGKWTVTYPTTQIPSGEHEFPIKVIATDTYLNETVITDVLVIDTIAHTITFNEVTDHNLVNFTENRDGFTISGAAAGTASVGATLTVTVTAGTKVITETVTVKQDGTWSLSIDKGSLPGGEYDATVKVTTQDPAGNPTSQSHTFRVDTVGSVAFDPAKVTGDDIINKNEAASVTLTGTSEIGTTSVIVNWNGRDVVATVDATTGKWSAVFTNVTGTQTLTTSTALVTAKDAWGNVSTDSKTIGIDIGTSVAFDAVQAGDNVISGSERNAGVTLTGTGEPGATLTVRFENGTRTEVTVGQDGKWSARFNASEIADGNGRTATATVEAKDAAGNIASSTSQTIVIDTQTSVAVNATPTANGDGVINAVESKGGFLVTGTVELDAQSVTVTLGGTTLPVTLDAAKGTWSVVIPESMLTGKDLSTLQLQVSAQDKYGNTGNAPATITFDTLVTHFTMSQAKLSGDGYLNAQEAKAGFVAMSGTVEANSTVTIDIGGGKTWTAQADANGAWSFNMPTTGLADGSYTVKLTATDKAGNTRPVDGGDRTLVIDTGIPETPEIVDIVRDPGSLKGIFTDFDGENVTFHQVGSTGSAKAMGYAEATVFGKTAYEFNAGDQVPDGSYLVVTNSDAAQNNTSTLFIVNNTNVATVELGRDGLKNFDFSEIDLSFAPQANLSIDLATLNRLTGGDNSLTIRGDNQDSVTLGTGANQVTSDQTGFKAYSYGDGTPLIYIEDTVQVHI